VLFPTAFFLAHEAELDDIERPTTEIRDDE
jgi:hypothetical protein